MSEGGERSRTPDGDGDGGGGDGGGKGLEICLLQAHTTVACAGDRGLGFTCSRSSSIETV